MLDLVKKVAGMRGAGQEGEGERWAIYPVCQQRVRWCSQVAVTAH
jgi:hypothetical protein